MAFPLPHKYRQLRTFTLVHTDGRSQRTSLRACPSVWTEASGRLDRMWRRKGESRGKVSDMWKVKWDRMITFCVSEDRRADYEARREISVFYPNSFCWALSTFYSPLWSNCCIQQTFNNQTRFYLKYNRCLYVQFLNLYSQLRLPLGISLFANNIFLCIRHFYLFMCFWIYCSCMFCFFFKLPTCSWRLVLTLHDCHFKGQNGSFLFHTADICWWMHVISWKCLHTDGINNQFSRLSFWLENVIGAKLT